MYEPSGHDRPNPLDLSEQLLKGEIGTQSKTGKTALLVFFGKGLQNHTHFNEKALKSHNLSNERKMGSLKRNKERVLVLQKYQQTKKYNLIKGVSLSFCTKYTMHEMHTMNAQLEKKKKCGWDRWSCSTEKFVWKIWV